MPSGGVWMHLHNFHLLETKTIFGVLWFTAVHHWPFLWSPGLQLDSESSSHPSRWECRQLSCWKLPLFLRLVFLTIPVLLLGSTLEEGSSVQELAIAGASTGTSLQLSIAGGCPRGAQQWLISFLSLKCLHEKVFVLNLRSLNLKLSPPMVFLHSK